MVKSSPRSRRAKNREMVSSPTLKTPTRISLKTVNHAPNVDPYPNMIMKVYINKKLYSIYDRATKKYIYHADKELYNDFMVGYSKDGVCNAIYDIDGKRVYAKGQR
ncbi:hypothetical protein F4680DRAFT_464326 [Xylaria scruposa]|nr:hypothetical protein F4680DRAFT_464326 [Xylaria scruposa]